jgi:hypothetical protein
VTVLLEDEKGHEFVLAYLNPGDFSAKSGCLMKMLIERRSSELGRKVKLPKSGIASYAA